MWNAGCPAGASKKAEGGVADEVVPLLVLQDAVEAAAGIVGPLHHEAARALGQVGQAFLRREAPQDSLAGNSLDRGRAQVRHVVLGPHALGAEAAGVDGVQGRTALRAPAAGRLRDLLVLGGDADAVEPLRFTCRPDHPGDQRPSRDVDQVLARDRLGPATGRDDGQHLHGVGLLCGKRRERRRDRALRSRPIAKECTCAWAATRRSGASRALVPRTADSPHPRLALDETWPRRGAGSWACFPSDCA